MVVIQRLWIQQLQHVLLLLLIIIISPQGRPGTGKQGPVCYAVAAGRAAAILSSGDLVLDPGAAAVTLAGQPVRLTSLEYRLLHYLLLHAGRVVSRTELTEHLYDQDFDRDSNTMEVIIARLRRKIGAERILTQRGLGYRLAAAPGLA